MNPLVRLAAAAALLASQGAFASLHGICYEGPTRGQYSGTLLVSETLTVIAGCQDDSGARCMVRDIGADIPGSAVPAQIKDVTTIWTPINGVDVPGATFGMFEYLQRNHNSVPRATRLRVRFEFANGQTRECSVTPRGWTNPYGQTGSVAWVGQPTGTLTGFSTDASGLVSTGVWRATAPGGGVAWARVPADFIAVGGGAVAADGAFIERSRFSTWYEPLRGWEAESWTSAAGVPSKPGGETTAYVIGLRIDGLPTDLDPLLDDTKRVRRPGADLRSLVRRDTATTATTGSFFAVPAVGVVAVPGRVALGGGVETSVSGPKPGSHGLFVHENHPAGVTAWFRCILVTSPWVGCPLPAAVGWQVRAVAELGAHYGHATAFLASLPDRIDIGGQLWEVRGRLVQAPSAVSLGPVAEVRGLRGEYALAAAGAAVRGWPHAAYGDMAHTWLNRIEPRPDLGGASASTGTLYGASSTSLAAFAAGVKLVPAGTPPDVELPPRLIARDFLCLSLPELLEHAICRSKEATSLEVAGICKQHPDLTKYGLCMSK